MISQTEIIVVYQPACENYDLTDRDTSSVPTTIGKLFNEPTVNRQRLQVVVRFAFLGSTRPTAVHIDDEMNSRIGPAKSHAVQSQYWSDQPSENSQKVRARVFWLSRCKSNRSIRGLQI